MKIQINGLFGLYNNEIDLDKKCNILVGENGIGKTTVLKIIDCIYEIDFIELTKYEFKNVKILFNDNIININYADLFPDLKHIKSYFNKIKEDYTFWVNGSYELNLATEIIEDLIKQKLIYSFLRSCYFNQTQQNEIKKIISRYKFECPYLDEMLINDIKKFLNSNIINNSNIFYKSNEFFQTFNKELLKEIKLIQNYISNLGVNYYFFDMVDKYQLDNDLTNRSIVYSKTIDLLKNTDAKYLEEFCKAFDNTIDTIKNNYIEEKVYTNTKIYIEKNTKDIIKEFLINKNLNLNLLVTNNYFEDNFIEKINEIAITFYDYTIQEQNMPQNYNNKPINDQILFSFYNNKNTEENYNLYIKPIILKNSKFDFDFEEKKHYGGYYPYTSDDMAFYMFYNSHIKEILEYRSEKILKFQKIIDEYIQNKKVKVYPAGIRIYEKRIKIKEAGNFKVLTNYEKHIELHKLSSGEKKVLILFGLSMFCENLIYAIDEPELSLSVFWQEALLPDLLKYTNVKNLIVSTHSPNIIRNESLIDNIVYLPTGVYENE